MAILTISGRTAIAIALRSQAMHLAWGSGDPAWDAARVVESVQATALTAEVGRRQLDEAAYCRADPTGEIIVPSGRFRRSETPTNNLYVRAGFDFPDAAAATIREVAVFTGTAVKPGLPPGQRYFTPAEIDEPGTLLCIEHITTIIRSPAVRQSFEFVITI